MSATVQTSLFDFKPIERPRAEPPRVRITDRYEDGGYYRVFRTDALSIVNSLGRPFDGKALSDTRVFANDYHGKTMEDLYYRSGEERDQDRPIDSWLQCASSIFKLIGDGGRFSMDLQDDSEIDPYRESENDPSTYTEALIVEALKAAVPMDELRWFFCHSHAYAVHCYKPFSRDWKTGMMVRNQQFDDMCALADRLGIVLKLPQDVPKPEPEKWDILPAFWKNYCAHTKGCKRKKDGCVCCDRFLYNREPVQSKHLDMPGRKSSIRGCDPEECE